MLENVGICVVPGSGFKQKVGEYHFRITFLPQEEKIKNMLSDLESFHNNFLSKYSDEIKE
jgi:alanine transaminase